MEKNNFKETIIVTGGAGFIGSNFLNLMVPRYKNNLFVNIDCLTYAGDLKNITVSGKENYKFEKTDIRDKDRLEKIFKKYKPTGIIHFAAESHVDFSISNPKIFIETNIIGTHNILELAKKYQVKRFHQISTDEVYGSLEDDKGEFYEYSQISPNNPYSASKAGAEMLVRAYNKTFGINTVVTRCSNNYGPNQDTSKLIPKFLTNAMKKIKLPIYANGKNVRDWIYVNDHAEAINLVFRKGKNGEVYNVGGNCKLTNIDVTEQIIEITGNSKELITYVTDRPGHDFCYALNCSKIKKELGWKPKVSFKEGLIKTMKFYKKNLSKN